MRTILVVEDELSIRSFVSFNLKRKNYKVVEAETGEKALEIFQKEAVEVVLLDIMLPGIDGFEVCEKMRTINPMVGIIMLTARTQEEDKVKGLIHGADDYITKPFSIVELEARMVSLLRRLDYKAILESKEVLTSGGFELDLSGNLFKKDGVIIKVTPTEFCILQVFLSHKNKIYTRDQLLDEVWGVNYVGDVKVVDVNIRRLRRKIEEDPSKPQVLCTEWGYGYIWKE